MERIEHKVNSFEISGKKEKEACFSKTNNYAIESFTMQSLKIKSNLRKLVPQTHWLCGVCVKCSVACAGLQLGSLHGTN